MMLFKWQVRKARAIARERFNQQKAKTVVKTPNREFQIDFVDGTVSTVYAAGYSVERDGSVMFYEMNKTWKANPYYKAPHWEWVTSKTMVASLPSLNYKMISVKPKLDTSKTER